MPIKLLPSNTASDAPFAKGVDVVKIPLFEDVAVYVFEQSSLDVVFSSSNT